MWSKTERIMILTHIRKKLFKLIPKGQLKNKILANYSNIFKNYDFYIYYKKGYFQYEFKNGIILKFNEDVLPDLKILKGYVKYYNLQRGDIVIDCGAYVGAFSLYAAKIIGNDGMVIAFEPDIINYKKLINNIKLNDMKNITVINCGVWNENTILKFYSRPNDPQCSSLFNDTYGEIIDIPVVTIDKELEKRYINRVNFIKMDIEGAEIEAIKGAESTLKNNALNLAIASYHIVDGQKTCFVLEKLLFKLGYNCKTTFIEHLTTYARQDNKEIKLYKD